MRDGEGCERLWSKLVKLIRLNRRAKASLRPMNLHFKVDEIHESTRTDLGGCLFFCIHYCMVDQNLIKWLDVERILAR